MTTNAFPATTAGCVRTVLDALFPETMLDGSARLAVVRMFSKVYATLLSPPADAPARPPVLCTPRAKHMYPLWLLALSVSLKWETRRPFAFQVVMMGVAPPYPASPSSSSTPPPTLLARVLRLVRPKRAATVAATATATAAAKRNGNREGGASSTTVLFRTVGEGAVVVVVALCFVGLDPPVRVINVQQQQQTKSGALPRWRRTTPPAAAAGYAAALLWVLAVCDCAHDGGGLLALSLAVEKDATAE